MAFGMMGRIFTDFGAGMTRNFPLGMQDGVVAIVAVLLMLLVDILCEKQPDLRKKLARFAAVCALDAADGADVPDAYLRLLRRWIRPRGIPVRRILKRRERQ